MRPVRAPGGDAHDPHRPRAADAVRRNRAVAEYVERGLERGEHPVTLVPPAASLRRAPSATRSHTEHAEP
ncbi:MULTISPECIES: hypothetical protein [unclassified Streptomyces]|uniref:hypothetical protein n=1 Tax=unclassified Streptomyces TaxID=2593676 RepID=UPI0009400BA3|nr:hypothetical protein [Streptomyces sp. CB02400]OKJ91651.1 hypothetical protein AMK33_35025 [Streptomyces sp. CB02400]